MHAFQDPFTNQTCDRLQSTCMGLGLVRLLQDAKRFEEARMTLYALETGFQAPAPREPRNPSQPKRSKRFRSPGSAQIDAA